MILRAKLFPTDLVHGFTTRDGGVSEGAFASLNFGRKWGDLPERVDENYRRVAGAAGYAPGALRLARQVHRADVVAARECEGISPEADAVFVRRGEGLVAGVLTADCVPVLLVEPVAGLAAAVHSGWRGTVAGITQRAVEVLVREGGDRSRIMAAIGPCIELAAFEVGEEVAEQFAPEHVDRKRGPRPHVDLVAAVRAQLAESGVRSNHIERVGACTHANPNSYYSYRREGAGTGQHLSFVGI